MRAIFMTLLIACLLAAQTEGPLKLDIAPLAPADLESPYASPRDAARHRLQVTLAELQSKRDVKAAIAGFNEALRLDRAYAAAAWNLAIVDAVAEKWSDAISVMEQAARLDPANLGKAGAAQIERLRLFGSLWKTAEGQRKLRYDAALYPVVQRLGKGLVADSMAALAELGRLDPKRWEAPALLAGLNGENETYDMAAKFLEIAVANASDFKTRTALEKALRAARRELDYAAARASAEAACDGGEYRKAAELYEKAWAAIPARAANGMEAAADWLAGDDTAAGARVLLRLKQSGDSGLAAAAGRMLDQIKAIEPAAAQPAPDSGEFFRDGGSAEPPRIFDMLPPMDLAGMEVAARPLARMVDDSEAVAMLADLARDRPEGAPPAALPQLSQPRAAAPSPSAPENPQLQTARLPGNSRKRGVLGIITRPAGARVFVGAETEALCQSPCDIDVPAGAYELRATLLGFDDKTESVEAAGARTDVELALMPARGAVLLEAPMSTAVSVNGQPLPGGASIEIALAPGLYRFEARFDGSMREQWVTVKPAARLRISLKP